MNDVIETEDPNHWDREDEGRASFDGFMRDLMARFCYTHRLVHNDGRVCSGPRERDLIAVPSGPQSFDAREETR